MKATRSTPRWVPFHEVRAWVEIGWTILSYGTVTPEHYGDCLIALYR